MLERKFFRLAVDWISEIVGIQFCENIFPKFINVIAIIGVFQTFFPSIKIIGFIRKGCEWAVKYIKNLADCFFRRNTNTFFNTVQSGFCHTCCCIDINRVFFIETSQVGDSFADEFWPFIFIFDSTFIVFLICFILLCSKSLVISSALEFPVSFY